MLRQYRIILDDPISEARKDQIADDAGIYFVFSAIKKMDAHAQIASYAVQKLLYIGRAKDVNARINGQHHKYKEIIDACRPSFVPLYYYGRIVDASEGKVCVEQDYVRVESALIYNKKPQLNQTANMEFHHDITIISLVRSEKTVNRNPASGIPNALPCAFGNDTVVVI